METGIGRSLSSSPRDQSTSPGRVYFLLLPGAKGTREHFQRHNLNNLSLWKWKKKGRDPGYEHSFNHLLRPEGRKEMVNDRNLDLF